MNITLLNVIHKLGYLEGSLEGMLMVNELITTENIQDLQEQIKIINELILEVRDV